MRVIEMNRDLWGTIAQSPENQISNRRSNEKDLDAMKNFNEIKQHLKELAEIVNLFKSEAVQLRVVELVFGADTDEADGTEVPPAAVPVRRAKRKKRAPKSAGGGVADDANEPSNDSEPKARKVTRPAGKGAKAVLGTLREKGFFKKPQTIRTIVEHCKTHMALTFKQSDFSGALARAVRDEVLTRRKNDDNQYEYTER